MNVKTVGMGLTLVWMVAIPTGLMAQERVDFAGESWEASGDLRVAHSDGREILQVRTARLVLADAEFGDGTIEFDYRTTGHRSFAGLGFRLAESGRDFEYFYIRPHQTGRFDAMQYTPVDHGLSAWQIYAEHNATADFPPGEWVHVRLVVEGPRLRVFVGDADQPAMRVDRLLREPARGGLVVSTSFPEADAVDVYPSAFADLRIRPASGEPSSEGLDPVGNGGPTMVQRWEVSEAFPAPAETVTELPARVMQGEWESLWTHDVRGRLNLGRHRVRTPGGDFGTTVLARTVIRSDRDQVKRLDFGFSDRGSVFLDGRLIFTGDNTYLSRSERYLGVMTVENDALYLPLHEGDNEVVFAVSERFGGWGVVARLGDLDGIEVNGGSTP